MALLKKIKTILSIVHNIYNPKKAPILGYINLNITSLCNLDCVMCEARDFKKEHFTSLKLETFKKVVDDATTLGLSTINLAATGESTVHPDFPEMVSHAHKKGIKLRLVTNLNYLNDKILNSLTKFEQIHVSIDGCKKETYEKIRKGGKWEKLLQNIKKVREANKTANMVVNFCVQKDNYKELPLLLDTFLPLGFNEINIGGLMNQNDLHEDQKIREKEWNNFIKLCEKTSKLFQAKKLNIPRVINPENLKKIKDPQVLRLGYDVFEVSCYHYHFGCYIAPTGNVYPCCFYDYNEGFTGRKEFCAGNVNEESIKTIWKGAKIKELRELLLTKKFGMTCQYCSNSINKEINKLVRLLVPKKKF